MDLDTAGPADSTYGYFVLQARSDRGGITGVLENLATGEKRHFGSSDELVAFVRVWPSPENRPTQPADQGPGCP